METPSSKFLLLFLMFILLELCASGSFISGLREVKRADEETKHSYRRKLIQTIQHDFMNPPITTYPTTTPVTNPVTTPNPGTVIAPPDPSTPPIFPIPSANPVTESPPLFPVPSTNPVTETPPLFPTPSTNPATATPNVPVTFPPITDPINPPTPVTNPVTTPSTTIPGGTTPVVAPPAITNAPAVPGQSWCVARGGLPETTTQVALDYACGLGGADCSAIQQGSSCYNPNTLQNHASYAFNSYYQKNPVQTSCDFGGAAMITNLNPSTGSCVFTTSSSSTTSPIPVTTPTPTPTTDSYPGALPSGFGTPPGALSASSPALGGGITGNGENPPTASISTASSSRPFIWWIVVVISIITGRIDFNI